MLSYKKDGVGAIEEQLKLVKDGNHREIIEGMLRLVPGERISIKEAFVKWCSPYDAKLTTILMYMDYALRREDYLVNDYKICLMR